MQTLLNIADFGHPLGAGVPRRMPVVTLLEVRIHRAAFVFTVCVHAMWQDLKVPAGGARDAHCMQSPEQCAPRPILANLL